jgi:hypothetical protein
LKVSFSSRKANIRTETIRTGLSEQAAYSAYSHQSSPQRNRFANLKLDHSILRKTVFSRADQYQPMSHSSTWPRTTRQNACGGLQPPIKTPTRFRADGSSDQTHRREPIPGKHHAPIGYLSRDPNIAIPQHGAALGTAGGRDLFSALLFLRPADGWLRLAVHVFDRQLLFLLGNDFEKKFFVFS